MKKALVTGGAGFIGSHLCESLLKKGFEVIVIDNSITGRGDNIKELISNPNFSFLRTDICEPIKVEGDIDFIFNLASPASPVDYQLYPIETLEVGSRGMKTILELAKLKGARVLQASTSEVYGDPLQHPQKESYWGNANSFGPRSCYDESKRFAEALCYTYLTKYDVDVRVVRIFNTYGPKMRLDDGRVVPNLISQALKGEPLTVYGDGSQTRSFCYVSDLVGGIEKMMLSEKTRGEVVNLGNPSEFTILEFANIVKRLTNCSSGIIFKPLPKDDPTKRKPDISKAGRLLEWEPKVSLEVGLQRTIEYFKGKIF